VIGETPQIKEKVDTNQSPRLIPKWSEEKLKEILAGSDLAGIVRMVLDRNQNLLKNRQLTSAFAAIDLLFDPGKAMSGLCWTHDSVGTSHEAKRTRFDNFLNLFFWTDGVGDFLTTVEQAQLTDKVLMPLWRSVFGSKHLVEEIRGREGLYINTQDYLNAAYLFWKVSQHPDLNFGVAISQQTINLVRA